MLLYIMGDSQTTKPLNPIKSGVVHFTQDELSSGGMKELYDVFSSCRNAIDKAHSNAREAFRHQQEVRRFLTSKTVFTNTDKTTVDYDKSNSKVNLTRLQGGKMFYIGNRKNWSDIASEYVGKWTMNERWAESSNYIFEGKHIHVGDDLKDSGAETLKGDHFYGKFATGNRTSGVYTWSNDSFYMGNFKDGNVHGFGCLKQVLTDLADGSEFIFGEFNDNNLPKSYILKRGGKIYWVSGGNSSELSVDQASQISYYLNKVTEDFKQLGLWTKGLHKLEDKTGLNRTGLYAIAALGLAGVGFWAYKKFRKSVTQKIKALTKAEKAAITRAKNKAAKAASASVSASESPSGSNSALEDNSGSGSASAIGRNADPAVTRKNKSASKSSKRSEAGKKGALTRAANKAAKAANVKLEGSNVKLEGSIGAWSSPAESKEAVSNDVESKVAVSNATGSPADAGLRRSQRIRDGNK
jgi:hypothetical protein